MTNLKDWNLIHNFHCVYPYRAKPYRTFHASCLRNATKGCQIMAKTVTYLKLDCLVEEAPFARVGQKPWCMCVPFLETNPLPAGSPSRRILLCFHDYKKRKEEDGEEKLLFNRASNEKANQTTFVSFIIFQESNMVGWPGWTDQTPPPVKLEACYLKQFGCLKTEVSYLPSVWPAC